MKKHMFMKIIFLFPILLIGFCNTTRTIIILPPDKGPYGELGEAIGSGLANLLVGLAERKAQEERSHQIRKAYLNSFASAIKQPKLQELIGKPQKQSNNVLLILTILLLLALFYFKNNLQTFFKKIM